MEFYELKLVCLVWDKSWIGWLVEYWHEIGMFWDNIWFWCEKHECGM